MAWLFGVIYQQAVLAPWYPLRGSVQFLTLSTVWHTQGLELRDVYFPPDTCGVAWLLRAARGAFPAFLVNVAR